MVRRIVTGNNAEGRSYFIADDDQKDGMDLWWSARGEPLGLSPDGAPTQLLPATAPFLEPPAGGSRVVLCSVPPLSEISTTALEAGIPGYDSRGFHRTESIDYIIMASGEITLELDEGAKVLLPGDLVIHRNTNHAWFNYGNKPAEFWCVVVSAKPWGGQ